MMMMMVNLMMMRIKLFDEKLEKCLNLSDF
jgi:hypothetical protein